MESQEWIFHADHPALRGIAINDLPTLPLDVSVPPRVLNRRRNAISTSCNLDAPEPRMSRRGAISYEEDHDFARFVRGLSDLVTYQHAAVARTCSADPRLQAPLTTNDMVNATNRRCKRRGSLLATNTSALFSDLAAAGADLELIDVNRMCTEANMVCINSWDFDVFAFRRMTKGHPLLYMGLYLFNYHNLVDKFSLNPLNLRKFLTIVEANYNPSNCYHNSTHASDVAQAMHCLISDKKIYHNITPEELLAMIIAALCHDLDHPGVNPTYLINTSDYLTAIHGKHSLLERHHCMAAKSALANSGLLDHLPTETTDTIISLMEDMILATDVTRHMQFLEHFQAKLMSSSVVDLSCTVERHFVLMMALKAADISNPARTLHISKLWSENIMEEFFRQGDLEKEKNLAVSFLCDRCTTVISVSQSNFFEGFALPMFQCWDKFVQSPLSKLMCNNIATNKMYWDSLKSDNQQ